MPWKVTDIMSQRYEFCQLASASDVNISALCALFQISRTTGYKWLGRYVEGGYPGLSDRSRRPHHSPGRTDREMERRILALHHRYPYWGARKLRRLLQQDCPDTLVPSVVTVFRILQRHGKTNSRQPPPDWTTVQRFAAAAPNDLWQMDLKAPLRLPDHRKWYPVGLLDDHSRYLLGLWLVPEVTDDRLMQCWVDASRQYGLPRKTLTDHGPQFRMVDEETSAFGTLLWACGVTHTQGRIGHPQTQGKIERLWRTVNTEVLRCHGYVDPASWQRCFDDWRWQYNQVRPHQELGDDVPAKHYRPSHRHYVEPDRHQRVGQADSLYRRVNPRGQISLGGHRVLVGRGLRGWTVEARPLGDGCWHVYFRHHFVRELMLSAPVTIRNSTSEKELSSVNHVMKHL
jgi:transposase InsO family protein